MNGKSTNIITSRFLSIWADREGISKVEANRRYKSLKDTIIAVLSNGKGVSLEGLGVFELVVIPAARRFSVYEKKMIHNGPRWKLKFIVSSTLSILLKRVLDDPTDEEFITNAPRGSKRGKKTKD